MFGRCATLPIDLNVHRALPEEQATRFLAMQEPDLERLAEQRAKQLEEAKENILAAQAKQKEAYDKKHAKPDHFLKGQLVLKKDFTRKKRRGGKLDVRYLGPYIIQRQLQRGTYELVTEDGKSTVRATGAHLKPYNRSSQSVSLQNQSSQTHSPHHKNESRCQQEVNTSKAHELSSQDKHMHEKIVTVASL